MKYLKTSLVILLTLWICTACDQNNSEELQKTTVLKKDKGIEFSTLCETKTNHPTQPPKCIWQIEGCGTTESLNEEINDYGWYHIYDSSIIFYSDKRYGVTFGWHQIVDGESVDFPEVRKLFNDSLKGENCCFYRNGQITKSGKSISDVVIDYGQLKGIDTPNFEREFGIYRLNEQTNKLEVESSDFDYDILSKDGIFYVTLPGLIPHVQVSTYCN